MDRFGDSWAARIRATLEPGLDVQPSHARVLGEWARTRQGGQAYQSLLAEGEWTTGRHRPYLRLEQSDRPEPDRSDVPDPHGPGGLLGVTRWSVVTLGYGYRFTAAGIALEPLVEVALANVRETSTGAFDPVAVYGRGPVRSITLALRARLGFGGTMGRYGVWLDSASASDHAAH